VTSGATTRACPGAVLTQSKTNGFVIPEPTRESVATSKPRRRSSCEAAASITPIIESPVSSTRGRTSSALATAGPPLKASERTAVASSRRINRP
jgi:hypothetical protein